jgi:molecular chaperone DnaK
VGTTIDLGIDLGTTNSAVAVVENGRALVLKDLYDNRETLPSCVSFAPDGTIRTGQLAQNDLLTNPDYAFEGFKRWMGTKQSWTSPDGNARTPEALSAEILRELRNRAALHLNENPTESVITVPAAFGEIEKHAVILASQRAGFENAVLVHEPVAAGLAYGWDRREDTRPFLVYDLGGGTFDASVLRCIAGQLVVLGHHGNHTEGGRDMDDAILNELVIPQLSTDMERSEVNWRRARVACEEAKIRLSTPGIDSWPVDLSRVQSEDRQPIQQTVRLQRHDFERLLNPQIDRTIQVVRDLLSDVGLSDHDLDAVILVGGPTRIPHLRRLLQESLEAQIFTRIDPMTVVAQGAALFAASILKSPSQTRVANPGTTLLRLEYEPVASQGTVPVGVASSATALADGSMVRIRRYDGLWDSGLVRCQGGVAMVHVALANVPVTTFEVEIFDQAGAIVQAEPHEFQITRGLAAAPPPLSRAIGVMSEDPLTGEMHVQIEAERGQPTPLLRRGQYVTTRQLVPGRDEEVLRVGFFEGPPTTAKRVVPERCRHIGDVVIRGVDLDRPLPIGTDLDVSVRIDQTREANGRVYIPFLNKTIEANLLNFELTSVPTPEALEVRLEKCEKKLAELENAAIDVHALLPKIASARETFYSSLDAGDDALARADARLQEAELLMDDVEAKEAPRLALQDLEAYLNLTEDIVVQFGEQEHTNRLVRLRSEVERAKSRNDTHEARSVRERLLNLAGEVYWSQPGAWVSRFQELATFDRYTAPDQAQALIRRGRAALEAGDLELLRRAVIDLIALTPREEQEGRWSLYAGITKRA